MDSEIIITAANYEAETDLLWEAACRILQKAPQSLLKPKTKWSDGRLLDGRPAMLGPDRRTIFLNLDCAVYRGHLIHEMGHCIQWQVEFDEHEFVARMVEEAMRSV